VFRIPDNSSPIFHLFTLDPMPTTVPATSNSGVTRLFHGERGKVANGFETDGIQCYCMNLEKDLSGRWDWNREGPLLQDFNGIAINISVSITGSDTRALRNCKPSYPEELKQSTFKKFNGVCCLVCKRAGGLL